MAKLLDVSMNTYIRWEKNPGKMPLAKAQAFANALGINFNDIIFLPNNDTECVAK
jgi:DNA-binding XRE family transcriptional regulator